METEIFGGKKRPLHPWAALKKLPPWPSLVRRHSRFVWIFLTNRERHGRCTSAGMLIDSPINRLTALIIEAAIALPSSAWTWSPRVGLSHLPDLRAETPGFESGRQRPVPLNYCGLRLECGYRLDLVVEDLIVVEVKTVERFGPIHEAQMMTYLRLTDCPLGLLLNFNSPLVKQGVKRIANNRSTKADWAQPTSLQ